MNEVLSFSEALLNTSTALLETNLSYLRPTDQASQILDQKTPNLHKETNL